MTAKLTFRAKTRLYITKSRQYAKFIISLIGSFGSAITGLVAVVNLDTTFGKVLAIAAAALPFISSGLVFWLRNTTPEEVGVVQAVLDNDASNDYVNWTPEGTQRVSIDGLANGDQNGGDGTPYEVSAS